MIFNFLGVIEMIKTLKILMIPCTISLKLVDIVKIGTCFQIASKVES